MSKFISRNKKAADSQIKTICESAAFLFTSSFEIPCSIFDIPLEFNVHA